MKRKKHVLKNKKWLLTMLVLSPNLLLAQGKDSIAYKKNSLYIMGGLQIGAGFGTINKLSSYNPPLRSGGPCIGISTELLRNRNFLQAKVYGYTPTILAPVGFLSCQLLAGRQLPLAEAHSFSIAAGLSFDKFSYDGQPVFHSDGSMGIINGYYTTDADHTSAIGVPIEITYTFTQYSVMGSSITYGVHLNNKVAVSTLTVSLLVGKLREKKPNDKKPHRLF